MLLSYRKGGEKLAEKQIQEHLLLPGFTVCTIMMTFMDVVLRLYRLCGLSQIGRISCPKNQFMTRLQSLAVAVWC